MALASITLWLTSKERPLQLTSNQNTILFIRAEVATSSEDLAINFEFANTTESESELVELCYNLHPYTHQNRSENLERK